MIYKTIICIEKGTLKKIMKYFLIIKLIIKSLNYILQMLSYVLYKFNSSGILISIILCVENYFIANFGLHLKSKLNIYLQV